MNKLIETPDRIIVNGVSHDFESSHVTYVFFRYSDIIDDDEHFLAVHVPSQTYYCTKKDVLDELLFPTKHAVEINARMNADISLNPVTQLRNRLMNGVDTHLKLFDCCAYLGRVDSNDVNKHTSCKGRIYEIEKKTYITFWGKLSNYVHSFSDVTKFIESDLQINLKSALYQFENLANNSFISLDTVKYALGHAKPEIQSKPSLEQELHMKKALIGKKFLQVLQGHPANRHQLYAALEQEFNMPVAKIKQLVATVPLGAVVKRRLLSLL
jgi:hypothetical protein